MNSTKLGFLFLMIVILPACGSGKESTGDAGGDTVFETGPNVSLGPVEISVTMDSTADVVLSGSVTPTLIGIKNLGSIGWEVGFETTLCDALSQSDLLFILYENGDGEVMQHAYDMRQPFDIHFSDMDWVRHMKKEDDGSMVVFVEHRVAIQTNTEIGQQNGAQTSASDFIRDYYATINRGNYRSAWDKLTDNFKANYNSSGYGPYADWWKTVERVEVLSVNGTR